jgi:hypothetical protein
MGRGCIDLQQPGYLFGYRAGGTFREVDIEMTPMELFGQVFKSKRVEDIDGRYHKLKVGNPEAAAALA